MLVHTIVTSGGEGSFIQISVAKVTVQVSYLIGLYKYLSVIRLKIPTGSDFYRTSRLVINNCLCLEMKWYLFLFPSGGLTPLVTWSLSWIFLDFARPVKTRLFYAHGKFNPASLKNGCTGSEVVA